MPTSSTRDWLPEQNRRTGTQRRSGEERRREERRRLESMAESEPVEAAKAERRDYRRHDVANLRLQTPITGDVINTSTFGMALQTNESLNVGWSYPFRMRYGEKVIRIPGKVQWCRLVRLLRVDEHEFLPVFRLGVELAGSVWSKPQIHVYP